MQNDKNDNYKSGRDLAANDGDVGFGNALPTKEAARYVGCRSASTFIRERNKGLWPRPLNPGGRPERYSVAELDSKLNRYGNQDKIEANTVMEALGI
jgi:hypothetical protein